MKVTRRGFLKILPSVMLLPKALSTTKSVQAVEPVATDLIQVNKLDANTKVFSAADSVQWFRYNSAVVRSYKFDPVDSGLAVNETWIMTNRRSS